MRDCIVESLEDCQSVQSTLGVAECHAAFAGIDVLRGNAARAAPLFAAAATLLGSIGGEATGPARAEYGRLLASAPAAGR
jgi:hypothetical protein